MSSAVEPGSPQIILKSHPSLCWLAEHFYSHILLKTDDSSEQCSQPTELTELLSKCSYIVSYLNLQLHRFIHIMHHAPDLRMLVGGEKGAGCLKEFAAELCHYKGYKTE